VPLAAVDNEKPESPAEDVPDVGGVAESS